MKVVSAIAALAAGVSCNKAVLIWDPTSVDIVESTSAPLLVETLENAGYTVSEAGCNDFDFNDLFEICPDQATVQGYINDADLVVFASNHLLSSGSFTLQPFILDALAKYVRDDGGNVITFPGVLMEIYDKFEDDGCMLDDQDAVCTLSGQGSNPCTWGAEGFVQMLPAYYEGYYDSSSSNDIDMEFDIYKSDASKKVKKSYLKGIKKKTDLFPQNAHMHPAEVHMHSRVPGENMDSFAGYDIFDFFFEPTIGSEVFLDSMRFGAYFSQKTTGEGNVFMVNSNLNEGGNYAVHQLIHNIAVAAAPTSQKKSLKSAKKSLKDQKKAHKKNNKSIQKVEKKRNKTLKKMWKEMQD